ncbi:NAD-dependent epimerase/dehydratase family protein [Gracilimonas mengyeensis]|uniref:Nucleoside-diphosphate-sugar epimerase n=1 Tax=Gracilimonas mengyeensis TaxID=1302730 RepID=A0A521F5C8_9BACT|nr:NAD-dependent epimerase/dehydratase family protein [Gracilimonas mengyeensis]SMO90851.1 Nucleoside-diphosphate-sugar epimerase [Gracilimonas mengyeensis]
MKSDKTKAVLIIGCGWTGKKLGQYLNYKGYTVFGTTRSQSNFPDLREHSIEPVQLELPANDPSDITLPEADTVVVSISPGSRQGDRSHYPKAIAQLARVLGDDNAQVLMYSSSSVYGRDATGVKTEEDATPDAANDHAILAAEGELRAQMPEAVILRLTGLCGDDRHPITYLAGKTELKNGDAPVNLVHREDIIRATELMIEENVHGEIFNVCSPEHPAKKKIYPAMAKKLNLEPPVYQDGGADGKVVSPQKLMDTFNFEFVHPDPMEFSPKI